MKAKGKKTRNKRTTFKEDSMPQYKWIDYELHDYSAAAVLWWIGNKLTSIWHRFTTDCLHSPYIPPVIWYSGWIKLRLFVDTRICGHCELIWWINPYTCPAKSKFNLGNFTAWYMLILVPLFRSGALCNFCYNVFLLYIQYSICITCLKLENVQIWRRQVEWFLLQFFLKINNN